MANNVTFKNMNVKNVKTDLNSRIKKPEHMLGRSLLQLFCDTNSGSRKLMHSTHLEQRLPLLNPDVPMLQTGYENEFGRYSSSFYQSESEYIVLAKIQKFQDRPNHHYFLIVQDVESGCLDVIEKINYEFITETYGFLYDNSNLDRLQPVNDSGEITDRNVIHKQDVYKKSMAFDEYNNRRDGVNLKTAYMATMKNTEDSVIISESAAEKLSSPLVKPVTIIVNENDILLNIYGDEYNYKSFPDIGEEVANNLLTVVRREKKEESLFTHSYQRLTDFLPPDDKFMVSGKIVDIDVYCNNPDTINQSGYNNQIKKYNDNKLRYMHELVTIVDSIMERHSNSLRVSYTLDKMLNEARRVLNGVSYINDNKTFNGTMIKLTVLEENKIKVGDKISDRYGGKGVVSFIVPDNEMPIIAHTKEPVDIIFNSCTCVGRLNPGQMFETSTTFIGKRIIDYILLSVLTVDESVELVREYMQLVGCDMDEFLEEMLDPNSPEEYKTEYINSIINDSGIMLSLEPISNSMTIDKLGAIYDEFKWAIPYEMIMPIKDSCGNIRYTKARRPMVVGTKYIYRLKQYGEDKFSATSSSATNIRNLNTRSKANKQYKSPHTRTPIRFGDMESGNLNHMGNEIVAAIMMMYSSSPHARRSIQTLYTGNPFDINIKLDNKAKNRNVEVINARLKTCGYKLEFKKVPKKLIQPVKKIRRDVVKKLICPVQKIRTDVVKKIRRDVVQRID